MIFFLASLRLSAAELFSQDPVPKFTDDYVPQGIGQPLLWPRSGKGPPSWVGVFSSQGPSYTTESLAMSRSGVVLSQGQERTLLPPLSLTHVPKETVFFLVPPRENYWLLLRNGAESILSTILVLGTCEHSSRMPLSSPVSTSCPEKEQADFLHISEWGTPS